MISVCTDLHIFLCGLYNHGVFRKNQFLSEILNLRVLDCKMNLSALVLALGGPTGVDLGDPRVSHPLHLLVGVQLQRLAEQDHYHHTQG